jgi:hypothetical protein
VKLFPDRLFAGNENMETANTNVGGHHAFLADAFALGVPKKGQDSSAPVGGLAKASKAPHAFSALPAPALVSARRPAPMPLR